MADLRLVGVHEDGEHLLLSGAGGEIHLLPIDEALRLATMRKVHRAPGQDAAEARLSPREIQAQIRSGASAADIAEHAGLSLEQVRRYEGPVLAEREHVAELARKVVVAASPSGSDSHRAVFGETPVTLDEMVVHRLSTFGIDPATLRWDAWRVHDGSWTVTADFEPGDNGAAGSIGEPAPARWTFHTGRKSLFNANRWAQQLSELEPVDGPVPERRLAAVADRPFDFETDTEVLEGSAADGEAGSAGLNDDGAGLDDPADADPAGGLLDMLRSRRGQRLGLDEDGDDDLAALLGAHVPGSHPQGADDAGYDADGSAGFDADGYDADGYDGGNDGGSVDAGDGPSSGDATPPAPATHGKKRLRGIPFLSLAPSLHGHGEEPPVGVGEVSTETREITLSGAPSLRQSAEANGIDTNSTDAANSAEPGGSAVNGHRAGTGSAGAPVGAEPEDAPSDTEVAERLERKATAKPKRSSVPSWDEIVFGTKGD